ncbi:hypothetical protein Dimus_018556 [Dionaea muscipula]
MEGESSEIQGWCSKYEGIHANPKHIDDSESVLNEIDLEDIRATFPVPSQYSYSFSDGDESCIAAPPPSTIAIHFESLREIDGTGYWRLKCKHLLKIVETQSNIKSWKVKYVYVTSKEWDFGDEVAEVLKNPEPRPREVLNEVEMSHRNTFERFWTGGPKHWFQVITLRTLEKYQIATIPHPRMENMMAKLRAMYRSSGSEVLKPTRSVEQEQHAQQCALGSNGDSEEARPITQELRDIPVEEV